MMRVRITCSPLVLPEAVDTARFSLALRVRAVVSHLRPGGVGGEPGCRAAWAVVGAQSGVGLGVGM
jgi:hypothetical protein